MASFAILRRLLTFLITLTRIFTPIVGLACTSAVISFSCQTTILVSSVMAVTAEAERAQVPVEKMGEEKCPTCTVGDLVIRTGRFGKFVSCSRFPECSFTGKLIYKVEGMKCPDCSEGEIREKTSKRGKFYGCSRYPTCRFTSWKKPGDENNPVIMTYIPNPPRTQQQIDDAKAAAAQKRKKK